MKPTLEEAIKQIQAMPDGFAKEIFTMHPQVFIDLIPDNLVLMKRDRKSQKHKKRKALTNQPK